MKWIVISGILIIILLAILSQVAVPVHLFTKQFAKAGNADNQLPHVLLIGDSTTIRYFPFVRDALLDKAIVYRLVEYAPQRLHSLFIGGPLLRPVNCASTCTGINMLEEWIGKAHWDIIHFNWGIHDLPRSEDNRDERKKLALAVKKYRKNLETLVIQLEDKGTILIFSTTTPVPKDIGYIGGSVEAYNMEAQELMKEHNIEVNDLYNAILPYTDLVQLKKDIHFDESGSRIFASEVVTCILKAMVSLPE